MKGDKKQAGRAVRLGTVQRPSYIVGQFGNVERYEPGMSKKELVADCAKTMGK